MEAMYNKLKSYLNVSHSGGLDELTESLTVLCGDLQYSLKSLNNKDDKSILLKQHLFNALDLNTKCDAKVPDFKKGLDWLNVTEPLSLHGHLEGKIVLLDFFTYCCINCMHIIPDLKKIESDFTVEDGLVVIGVHSAKFSNESVTANIEAAVRRYEMVHPVVNDTLEGMWNSLKVMCWPTLYVLGPHGEPLLMLQGEGHYETLHIFIEETISHFKAKGSLSLGPISQISAFKVPPKQGILSFPGKICGSPSGKLLAISDSGNHRILIVSLNGEIVEEVGVCGQSGYKDGNLQESTFSSPQGLVFFDENTIFVADTENHSLRKVDLSLQTVSSLVSNHHLNGGVLGTNVPISSPWDLCLVDNILFIAMAGIHQIWAYFFDDTTLWKKQYSAGSCVHVVGSGREENKNSGYPWSAGLAQPSGLAYSSQHESLFVADSESSTLRAVNMKTGAVSLVVGGALDPKNLFAFGDVDGRAMEAKLQHPLGVAWHSTGLYAADSYNHKIKLVDPSTKVCTTLTELNNQVNEPGGLCFVTDSLYIADTNNHVIKVFNTRTSAVSKLGITYSSKVKPVRKYDVCIASGEELEINLKVALPEGMSVNTEAPSSWSVFYPEGVVHSEKEENSLEHKWNICCSESSNCVINCNLYLCSDDICSVRRFSFVIAVVVNDSEKRPSSLDILYTLQ